ILCFIFFSSRRRHTIFSRDWSSDACSSDLVVKERAQGVEPFLQRRIVAGIGIEDVHDVLDAVGGHTGKERFGAPHRRAHLWAVEIGKRRVGKDSRAVWRRELSE